MSDFANVDFGFRYGSKNAMDNTSYKEGRFNVAIDSGTLTVDVGGSRVKISDNIIVGHSEAEIRALTAPDTSKMYFANDTFNILAFDTTTLSWKRCLGELVVHAITADKDREGNDIVNTYVRKDDSSGSVEGVNNRIDSLEEDISNTVNSINNNITSIREEIESVNRFKVEILGQFEPLPVPGEKFVIYFVPTNSSAVIPSPIIIDDNTPEPEEQEDQTEGADGNDSEESAETADSYTEFIWLEVTEMVYNEETEEYEEVTKGYYEQIGLTSLDISNYYTKSQIDDMINNLDLNIDDSFTTRLNEIADNLNNNFYDRNQIDLKEQSIMNNIELTNDNFNNYYDKQDSDEKFVVDIQIVGNKLQFTRGDGFTAEYDLSNSVSISLDYGMEEEE